MVTEDQSEVVAFLESPATHGAQAVERVDTHASVVFLAGDRALKLKRAVRYDYLDFSTASRRKAMCEAELRLNRRTAPAIYRGVVPVTREGNSTLALGGHGEPVDWVLEMLRFDQEALLDRLAERGALPLDAMVPLAAMIARFHATAEKRPDQGGRESMRHVVQGNAAAFAEHGALLGTHVTRATGQGSLEAIARHGALLDGRRAAGSVRQCHGDLHLRNIVLLEGAPTLFDAIEFNDDISCIDVMYDLAFLLMDLWHRQLPRHANAVWNAYLAETGDLDGLALLPLFLSCRAAIRAKTSVTQAALAAAAEDRAALVKMAHEYLALADQLLQPGPPRLIAIGGLSGSGKSTLAQALAPSVGAVPGAVVLRSDEIRKRLRGADPLARLDATGYTTEVSRRVYGTLAERAARVLSSGHSAILDAAFLDPADRQAVERVAEARRVPFVGLWLDAPPEVLFARVAARRKDASDADEEVVRGQLVTDLGSIHWQRVEAGEDGGVFPAAARIVRDEAGAGSADRSDPHSRPRGAAHRLERDRSRES